MWVWEVVDEVEPITLLHSNPWELLLRVAYIAMLCYARRRGLGLSVSMTNVRLSINGLLKVATSTHIWVDWLRAPRDIPVLSFLVRHPGSKGS